MSYIGLRISVPDTGDNVVQWFNEFLQKQLIDEKVFAVFEHKGRDEKGQYINPHYHFMILNLKWTEALRKATIRFFEKKDSSYKSIQRGKRLIKGGSYTDFDKGYKYLCKGHKDEPPKVVINDELLSEDLIKYYYDLNYTFKSSKEDPTVIVKSKKEPKGNQVANYIKWMEKDIIPQWENDTQQQIPFFNSHRVASTILDFFNLNPKNPPLFMKRNIEMYMCVTMNTLARKYRPEEFEKWKKNYILQIYDIHAFP